MRQCMPGPPLTMLFTGKRLIGPVDDEEIAFLRKALSEPPRTLTVTAIDQENGTITLEGK